ncbi:MAG: hypothetical protein LC772_02915, partial [Chloroflexi bacterium]|nr:hypothetical protein [Chloroflexota bacterium]
MRIIGLKTAVLKTGSIFVRVYTDQGLIGMGECSPMSSRLVQQFVEVALKPLVMGEDPRDIDRLWHKMLHSTYKLGIQGIQPE